jgi:hypothetical protein
MTPTPLTLPVNRTSDIPINYLAGDETEERRRESNGINYKRLDEIYLVFAQYSF